jgi:hypothetical protein
MYDGKTANGRENIVIGISDRVFAYPDKIYPYVALTVEQPTQEELIKFLGKECYEPRIW